MKEQVRENDRALRKTERELARDRNALERQEKQLEQDIKQAAKRGDKQTATILAKQLVNLRKQKTRSHAASSKITAVGMQAKGMASQVRHFIYCHLIQFGYGEGYCSTFHNDGCCAMPFLQ